MSLLPVGISGEAQYQISRSLRFNSPDSAYLSRTPASASNRKTWTWSGWVKRGALPSSGYYSFLGADSGAGSSFYIAFDNSTQQLELGQAATVYRKTTQVFRDPSAWYHLVINSDTTQATASNRLKIYVNGVQVTAFATSNDPSLNGDWALNNNVAHSIGADIPNTGARNFFNGYLTEINFIDGSALDPTSFGEFNTDTGVWQPKAYTGSYGTNGFYLNFSDNSSTTTLGDDLSGNGNDWTTNNFSVTAGAGNDSLVDTPTSYGTDTGAGGEVRGNYCTLNPLDVSANTLSNGNLDITYATNSDTNRGGTIAVSTGKWYFEATIQAVGGTYAIIGVTSGVATATSLGSAAYQYSYISSTGNKFNNGSSTAYGNTYTTGDVIGVALDMDNGKVWFSKNGTWQASGDPAAGTNQAFSGLSGSFSPAINARNNSIVNLNCGQRPFAYTAPSGFKALCTQNLPEPTIKDGGDYFNTVLFTGTSGNVTVSGVGFQPDWVWIKARSNVQGHELLDAVRGGNKLLLSNSTSAESTLTSPLTFNSDGFVSTTDTHTNGYTYVAWNWKANGAGSSNTAGTITSTVSVNTTSGFSIVTYTGTGANATVGHGLGVAPAFIIVKPRTPTSTSDNWEVYHVSTGNGQFLTLNSTAAAVTASNRWNNTSPTSTVFSIGTVPSSSADDYVAYCFAPVAGFSRFGSYTGNGSTDGPFVFCNFRPALVMVKRTNTTGNWRLQDTARNEYNTDPHVLFPNLSDAEGTGSTNDIDILSNGFKLRNNSTDYNASGSTYIYMAFSEVGFKYALGR